MTTHSPARVIRNPLTILSVVFATLLLSACSSIVPNAENRPRLQQLEINSASKESIIDYQILYGTHRAPLQRERRFAGGEENILRRVSETITSPIPADMEIGWKTSDGKAHRAFVQIVALVSDVNTFHGIKVLFIDDHVDVYFMYEMPRVQNMYLNLKYVKAYSSVPER